MSSYSDRNNSYNRNTNNFYDNSESKKSYNISHYESERNNNYRSRSPLYDNRKDSFKSSSASSRSNSFYYNQHKSRYDSTSSADRRLAERSRSPLDAYDNYNYSDQQYSSSSRQQSSRTPAAESAYSNYYNDMRDDVSNNHYQNQPNEHRTNPIANNTLAIFSLDRRTTEQDLYDLYSEYGCKRCQIIIDKNTNIPRGFGFVNFNRIDEAIKAKDKTNGKYLYGRQIRVDFSYVDRANTKFDSDTSLSSLSSSKSNGSMSHQYDQQQQITTAYDHSYYNRKSIDANYSSSSNSSRLSHRDTYNDRYNSSEYNYRDKFSYNRISRKSSRSRSISPPSQYHSRYVGSNDANREKYSSNRRGPRTPSTSPPPICSNKESDCYYDYKRYKSNDKYSSLNCCGQTCTRHDCEKYTARQRKGPRTPSCSPPPSRSPSQDYERNYDNFNNNNNNNNSNNNKDKKRKYDDERNANSNANNNNIFEQDDIIELETSSIRSESFRNEFSSHSNFKRESSRERSRSRSKRPSRQRYN